MALQVYENQAKLLAATHQRRSPVYNCGLNLWPSPDLGSSVSARDFAPGTNETKVLGIEGFLRNSSHAAAIQGASGMLWKMILSNK